MDNGKNSKPGNKIDRNAVIEENLEGNKKSNLDNTSDRKRYKEIFSKLSDIDNNYTDSVSCLLYTSPSPRD